MDAVDAYMMDKHMADLKATRRGFIASLVATVATAATPATKPTSVITTIEDPWLQPYTVKPLARSFFDLRIAGVKIKSIHVDMLRVHVLRQDFVTPHFFAFDIRNHDEVPPDAVIQSIQLGNVRDDGKTVDCDDVTFRNASYDGEVDFLIWCEMENGLQPLIAMLSQLGYFGLPICLNGGDVNITWPNDHNKIFSV